jgi:hypothetical protein
MRHQLSPFQILVQRLCTSYHVFEPITVFSEQFYVVVLAFILFVADRNNQR